MEKMEKDTSTDIIRDSILFNLGTGLILRQRLGLSWNMKDMIMSGEHSQSRNPSRTTEK